MFEHWRPRATASGTRRITCEAYGSVRFTSFSIKRKDLFDRLCDHYTYDHKKQFLHGESYRKGTEKNQEEVCLGLLRKKHRLQSSRDAASGLWNNNVTRTTKRIQKTPSPLNPLASPSHRHNRFGLLWICNPNAQAASGPPCGMKIGCDSDLHGQVGVSLNGPVGTMRRSLT